MDSPIQELTPFRVTVRIRPLSDKEKTQRATKIIRSESNTVTPTQILAHEQRGNLFKESSFHFDKVFTERSENSKIYHNYIKPLIEDITQGLNGTCFAYGMTGAGKTHTMLGSASSQDRGIIYLAVDDCIASMQSKHCDFQLRLSYLEIYNEHVRDLLGSGENLMVVDDPLRGVLIPGLKEFEISSSSEAKEIIDAGNLMRVMASTSANQYSTRSHAVLQLCLEQTIRQKGATTSLVSSKMCMIDLAGSERAAASENRGQRMVEGANINRSLLALGNCINILSDANKRGKFVPYRDSKLTRILKESLGGNTQTIMIACISPASTALEETLNTLKYAERARNIKNKVEMNAKEVVANVGEFKDIICSLRQEVEFLKTQMNKPDEIGGEREREGRVEAKEGIEEISHKIMMNFEEHWEIKKSIREIEILNEDNTMKMKKLLGKYQNEELGSKELRTLKHELIFLKQNIKENEEARAELLENLYINLKAKSNLQQAMSILKKDDKKEILELQIMLRNLKLEALDLHIQNTQIKQEALKTKEESEAKDVIINSMKSEIENMKKKLSSLGTTSVIQSEEFSSSFINCLKTQSFEESPTVKQFLMSPKNSERKIKLSKLEEARRARKEVKSTNLSAKESTDEVTQLNFPDRFRANSVSTSSKIVAEPQKPQKNLRGAFSNMYQIETMKDRYKSVERNRTPIQTETERRKFITKNVVKQKSQASIVSLIKGLNTKLLTAEEASDIVKNAWNPKKKTPTPSVTISLKKT